MAVGHDKYSQTAHNNCFPQQRLKNNHETEEQFVNSLALFNDSAGNTAAAESSLTL